MIIKRVNKIEEGSEKSIRALLELAYEGDFSPEDWEHTFGGQYFIGSLDDKIIAHGSVVSRKMITDDHVVTVGYVEAIAVLPSYWRKGFGTQLMKEITQYCQENYEFSMLSTDENHFYERLGWLKFLGESFVRDGDKEIRTEGEDEGLMLLPGKKSQISLIRRVVCESRSGDDW